MGTFTFASIARLSDYRNSFTTPVKPAQQGSNSIPLVSSQIPTGPVDARTEQALKWSGLSSANSTNRPTSYKAPDLDLAYSFSSIKGILAYRDALVARNSEQSTNPSQDPS